MKYSKTDIFDQQTKLLSLYQKQKTKTKTKTEEFFHSVRHSQKSAYPKAIEKIRLS